MTILDGGGPKFSENCHAIFFLDFFKDFFGDNFRKIFKNENHFFILDQKKILDPRSHLLPCAVASFVSKCATLHGA